MSGDSPESQSRPDFVRSLARGLGVIRAFDAERREMRLSEVAEVAGLTRAAARRFLLTLGYSYLSGLSFAEISQPHMEELVHDLNESTSISVLDDLAVTYVVRVPTQRIMSVTLTVGARLPAHLTSMGRVLLSRLPPKDLERRLGRIELTRPTLHTIATKAAPRRSTSPFTRAGPAWSSCASGSFPA